MDQKSYSINEFCLAENISLSSYYKLKRAGKGDFAS